MKKNIYKIVGLILASSMIASCEQGNNPKPTVNEPVVKIQVPNFNSDSAFSFVKKQVDFGPRVPGSEAHKECANWLAATLESFGAQVTVQNFVTRVYTGKVMSGKNIIASYNPEAKKRIMLSAHWDSRPYGDYDLDETNNYKPIAGANDGASGVGVLLEIARLMQSQMPNIGVDIFFWDLEDFGEHRESTGNHQNSWALGSQYWSANPHIAGYRASYGILLDMVGAENPTFFREHYSMQYAPFIVEKVWKTAYSLGYGNIFINENNGVVTDDHYYINSIAGIPTIDIIHYHPNNKSGFFPQWHTAGDNMDIISKNTLEVVGKTVTHVIYYE
jgi:Zn-dependent M28 family amino/carboxypeptidase